MARAKNQNLALAAIFFALSGASALAYEVIWFKRFTHVWGNSSYAWASVVAAYLLGLGLGAQVFGRIAQASSRPLRLYGLCEIAVALFAVLVPLEIAFLFAKVSSIGHLFGDSLVAQSLVRFVATFVVLAPPTIAMGATLPLLVRHFVRAGTSIGDATGWLYGLNAIGAAIGAWVAGFELLPALGLASSNWIAAALSLAIGAAAFALGNAPVEADEVVSSEPVRELDAPDESPHAIRFAAAASGAASLALQMIWSRELAVLLGGSTYAYTAILAVFVLGLGLGGLVFRIAFASSTDLRAPLAAILALIIGSTLVGRALEPAIAQIVGTFKDARSDSTTNAMVCALTSLALEGLPTFGMGLLFPAIVRLGARTRSDDARVVGSIYAWNSIGSIPAAALTCVALLPSAGSVLATKIALALYVVLLIVLFPPHRANSHVAVVATILAGIVALVFLPRPIDPLDTHLGYAIYGTESLNAHRVNVRQLFFANGASVDVLVTGENQDALPGDRNYDSKQRSLLVNGKVDATDTGDMSNQIALAVLPQLARPDAKNVLVIGFGSGTTAGTSLCFPGVKVTCCELEPAVAEAGQFFSEVNHRPWESPNFRMVHEDGRSWVQGTHDTFDTIISEPSNPWMAGVSNLFTQEFYVAAKARLSSNGVLAQWLQTYSLSLAEYAMVVRTLRSVFPHVALMRVSQSDTILLASAAPIIGDAKAIDHAQSVLDSAKELADPLQRWFLTRDARTLLVAHYALDSRGLDRLLAADGKQTLNRDVDLRLEFDSPRWLFGPPIVVGAPDPDRSLLSAYDPALLRDLLINLNCGPKQIEALRLWCGLMKRVNRPNVAAQVVELALTYAPDDASFEVEQLLLAPAADSASIDHLISTAPEYAYEAARSLAQGGLAAQALPIFERLREKSPQSVKVLTALATVYAAMEKDADSREAIDEALAIDPYDELARQLKRVIDAKR